MNALLRWGCLFALGLLAACHASQGKHEPPPGPSLSTTLIAAASRAEHDAGGRLGVAVLHVESGEKASFRGTEAFPMQSVFKLPLAVEVLSRVDAGELRLEDKVAIEPRLQRPGPEALSGEQTILELIEHAVIRSDNTAADALLDRIGGPQRVTTRLRALGIGGIDVSRSEAELMMDLHGVTSRPPRESWTLETIREVTSTAPDVQRRALAQYLADPRDMATPDGMRDLLLRVQRRDLLRRPSADLLVSILERTTTGKNRLRGLLPAQTVLAHKTGTSGMTEGISAATNDSGIITLPGTAGHVIVAVFLSASPADEAARDCAIATVSRAVYDHYVHEQSGHEARTCGTSRR